MQEKFDAAIALFHVMSYLKDDRDFFRTLASVRSHLVQNGIFIFDTWYGPAVLLQRPELRVKRMSDEKREVTRIAEPVLRENDNVCEVHYDVFVHNLEDGQVREIKELHEMRYYFADEIRRMLKDSGFQCLDSFEFMTGKPLSRATWGSCFVASKL